MEFFVYGLEALNITMHSLKNDITGWPSSVFYIDSIIFAKDYMRAYQNRERERERERD